MPFRAWSPRPASAARFAALCLATLLTACGEEDSSPTDPGKAPTAAFRASPTSGAVPLSVAFRDESSGDPTSWSWKFGDGQGSSAQNPTHVFTATGDHTVSLTVSNSAGSDTATRSDYVRVTPAVDPDPVLERIVPVGAGVGMQVTLQGQDFGANAGGLDEVHFGSVVAEVDSWTDAAIEVVVPTFDPPVAETAAVTVHVGGAVSNAVVFYRQEENVIRLTNTSAYEWQPYWGSNSTIFFASNATGNFNIWYMPAGGGDPVQRTFFDTGQTDLPAYSVPNLYYRSNHGGDWDIYKSSGLGSEVPITGTPEKDFEVCVAPDLAPYQIAISRAEEHNGGTIWNIYGYGSTGFGQISDNHADFHPTFSPNGQQVAYMYKFGDWDPGQIMVVSVHGGGSIPITDPEHNCAYPTWNQVHDTIAYTRSEGGGRNIFMCDPDGSEEVQLTFFRHDVVYPHWSPDGTRLAYASFVQGSYELFVLDVKDVLLGP